jgi:hypothetical protein
LGAGTSLIVAGVLCLAVISSIIAFRGFPGFGPPAARPPVRLVAPAADGTGRSAPAPIVAGATAGSATLTAPVRRPPRSATRAHADGPAVRIGSPPSAAAGSSPVAPIGDPVTQPPAATPSAGRPEGPAEARAPTPAARPVRQTVDRVRDAVAGVLPPPAPPAAQPVVEEVVGTANQVVDQADELVGSVLP